MHKELVLVTLEKDDEIGLIRSYDIEEFKKMDKEQVEKAAKMLESIALEIRDLNK